MSERDRAASPLGVRAEGASGSGTGPEAACADCGAVGDLYWHERDEAWVCEEVSDCIENQRDNAERERDDALRTIERLRLGFCDEAYILMVQAVDYQSLPKGRKRILTEQAVRMAKVGLSQGWPRGRDQHAERRAADVLAALDPSSTTPDPASERLGPEADNHV